MNQGPDVRDRVARWVLTLSIPFVLLLSNLYLLTTPLFVRFEYARPAFPPAELFSDRERLSLAEATVHYLRSGEGPEYLRTLRPTWQVYNEREVKHLVDVKVVMNAAFAVQAVALVLAVAAFFWLWRRRTSRSSAWLAVARGCAVLLAALLAVGVVVYFSFDVFFVFFHRVFFSGDSWLFAYTDTLIQLFPVQFWIDATWALALLAIAEAALVGGAIFAIGRRQAKAESD
jgi:integral membrane protein (TIGR01906 family)